MTMLLCAVFGSVAAQETFVFANMGYENAQDITEIKGKYVTLTFDKGTGSNSPKYYNTGTNVRLYGGNTLTISSTKDIASVQFSCSSGNEINDDVSFSTGTYEDGTWTGPAQEVTLNNGGKSQVRFTAITVNFSDGTVIPAIPTFSPQAGTYTSAQSVTITCATDGASIYYTTNGDDPTSSSNLYSGAITISQTTTLKAIAINDNGSSEIATAEYTIEQPISISAARQQDTGSVVFTTGTVTSVSGSTAYIQDASAAICVFGASGLAVGDNITVSGKLTTYNGLLEITNPSCSVLSQGNTISPTTKTIAEINADYAASNSLQGWFVRIEEATVKEISNQNTTISQGENTIVVRGISGVTLKVGDIVSLTGNIGCYNAAQIANPTDVIVTANETPSITATPTSIEANHAGTEGTISVTYYLIENYGVQFFEEDGTTPKDAAPDWITYEFDADGNLNYTIALNGGEERKAYFKVYGSKATAQENYFSELITVTQTAAPAALAIPWEEDFSAENALNKYTCNNVTIYDSGTMYAGGEKPELLIGKSGGSLSATFDLNGYSGDLTLSFLSNHYDYFTITCDESEVTASSTPGTYYLSIEEGTTRMTLTFENKNSSNARVDNFKLVKGKTSVLAPAGLAYSAKTFTATIGEENQFPVLSNENGLDVTYTSSDETVATIDATGKVTLVAAGTTTITATSEENDEFQAGSASYELTVKEAAVPGTDVYELVDDASTIAVGDKIIIVNDVNTFALSTTQNANNRAATNVSLEDDGTIIPSNEVQVLTIGGDESDWTFYTGDGYLYAASSDNNYLRTEEEASDNAHALIVIKNGLADISFLGTNTRNTLLYNASNKIFSCYAEGSTAGKAVRIYRYTENPKAVAGLSYSDSEFTAKIGEENTFPTLNNPNNLEVTFESSDETVATIDATGNVTLVAAGTTIITATSAETDNFKAGKASYVLTVVQPEVPQQDNSDVFELVTDFSTLAANDEIIFVGEITTTDEEENSTTNYYGLSTEQKPNNRGAVTVTHNADGTITGNNKLQTITLEGEEDDWYFNVGNGYLYAASNEKNYLRTEAEADANASAIISYDEEGKTSIVFQGTNTRRVLQFNALNVDNLLFSCYSSASQSEVKIYRKKAEVTLLMGDANGDGEVSIPDVMLTVGYSKNGSANNFHFENADMNGDGEISVADVMAIVAIILGN